MRDYRELKTGPRVSIAAGLPRAAVTACALPLALLFVQFLLGMYLNLFVAHPQARALPPCTWPWASPSCWPTCSPSSRSRGSAPASRVCVLATVGSLSTALASAAGFRFLDTGQNGWSFTMAVGFDLTAAADVLIPVRALPGRAS